MRSELQEMQARLEKLSNDADEAHARHVAAQN